MADAPTTPPAAETKKVAVKTKTFVVAKGRTLTHGDPDDPEPRNYSAGDKIELAPKEGARLQRTGHLLKDDGSTAVPAGGPPTEAGEELVEQAGADAAPRVQVTQV